MEVNFTNKLRYEAIVFQKYLAFVLCQLSFVYFSAIIREVKGGEHVVVIQCDASVTSGKLIACGRHRAYDVVIEENRLARVKRSLIATPHVVFVVYSPRSLSKSASFIGFLPKPWVSYHIDHLYIRPGEVQIDLRHAESQSMSSYFQNNSGILQMLLPSAISKIAVASLRRMGCCETLHKLIQESPRGKANLIF